MHKPFKRRSFFFLARPVCLFIKRNVFPTGAALDDNVANFFAAKIKENLPEYEFRHRVTMSGTAYGIVIKDVGLPKGAMKYFFKTFFDNNEDQREAIIAQAMAGIKVFSSIMLFS